MPYGHEYRKQEPNSQHCNSLAAVPACSRRAGQGRPRPASLLGSVWRLWQLQLKAPQTERVETFKPLKPLSFVSRLWDQCADSAIRTASDRNFEHQILEASMSMDHIVESGGAALHENYPAVETLKTSSYERKNKDELQVTRYFWLRLLHQICQRSFRHEVLENYTGWSKAFGLSFNRKWLKLQRSRCNGSECFSNATSSHAGAFFLVRWFRSGSYDARAVH